MSRFSFLQARLEIRGKIIHDQVRPWLEDEEIRCLAHEKQEGCIDAWGNHLIEISNLCVKLGRILFRWRQWAVGDWDVGRVRCMFSKGYGSFDRVSGNWLSLWPPRYPGQPVPTTVRIQRCERCLGVTRRGLAASSSQQELVWRRGSQTGLLEASGEVAAYQSYWYSRYSKLIRHVSVVAPVNECQAHLGPVDPKPSELGASRCRGVACERKGCTASRA